METISVPTRQILNLQKALHNLSDQQFTPLQAIYKSIIDTINEIDILCSEFNIGNTILNYPTLTCIHNNKIHKYTIIQRRAQIGEKILITKCSENSSFGDPKYIGRCFIVANISDTDEAMPYAEIRAYDKISEYDYTWIIFDHQYSVLEEYNSTCKIIPFPL